MRFIPLILLPGLASAQLVTVTKSQDQEVSRISAIPALYVEAGSPPASGLAPGSFTTTWDGHLNLAQRARLSFSFEGKGSATLLIDGKEVLKGSGDLSAQVTEVMRVNPGEVPIQVIYTSEEDGSGEFRLFWEERSFARESIPPTAFVTKPDLSVIDPAQLVAEHNCLKCHSADSLVMDHAMPELSNDDTPDLTHIGDRRQSEWLVQWLLQPDKLKPDTTMPSFLDHGQVEDVQQAADLAAYLATLKSDANLPAEPTTEELSLAGGAHFHTLGCVACHTLPSEQEVDIENHRIPLNNVASKYQPGTLVSFLKKPDEHWKAIKMPDFGFSDEEASAITAYLLTASAGKEAPSPAEIPAGDPARGAELAKSLNCASCHQGMPEVASHAPTFDDLLKLDSWSNQGCLAPEAERKSAPRLILSDEEKAALHDYHALVPKLIYDTPASYADRQFKALRCASCHDHDGQNSGLAGLHHFSNGLVAHLSGHDEKLEQSRPPLTFIGSMLNSKYFTEVLDGSLEATPRPWLEMRMPAFHHVAQQLPIGFAAQEGYGPSEGDPQETQQDLATIGADLVSLTGYACVTCHGAGDNKPLATFEVGGINFDQVSRRLRPGYYHRWMQNPQRVVPETKMPKYTQADGSALRADLLEGDAKKQFDAIWHYFKSIEKK